MNFDPGRNAEELIGSLRQLGSPDRAEQEKRYLKSELDFLGVGVPEVRRVVTAAVRRQPGLRRDQTLAWTRALWGDAQCGDATARPFEARLAAAELLRARVPDLTADDLPAIAGLIREAAGWALVDVLSGDVAGRIAVAHPDGWRHIDQWAKDRDFWLRRSALLALLPGIRAGQPDLDRIDRYASAMLTETEFFVRKAIGWVIRELSKKDPDYVIAWTGRHLATMSGVTFREAVRRLPAGEAARLAAVRMTAGRNAQVKLGLGRSYRQVYVR